MISYVDDISVFNPSGELSRVDGLDLVAKIKTFIQSDWSKIVIDLSQVDHIHYGVLGELWGLAEVSAIRAGGIKLANVSPYNRQILRLTGMDRRFETYDSVADAVLSFQNPLTKQGRLH
jgi:anti-anti-sigma factor